MILSFQDTIIRVSARFLKYSDSGAEKKLVDS